MASTTSDLTLLGRKLGALDYDPTVYVRDIARNSVGGHELIQHRNNIKTLSESTHTQLKKNVYQNYRQFIDTAKEISFLESEMYQLSHMITDQRNLLFELMQFSVNGEKVDIELADQILEKNDSASNASKTNSNTGGAGAGTGTTASDSKNIKKEFEEGRKKFEDLVNKVEGCTQIIEDPERCLVHDGDLVEIDITENTAIHRVHGYLTNDGFMVATWLPNVRGPKRFRFDKFYELDSLPVVDVRDLGGIKHAFKLLLSPEARLFQCANAEAKKIWMDAFEKAKNVKKEKETNEAIPRNDRETFSKVKSARRKPNQPSNPFVDSEDEDFIADEEKFDQSFKGESLRNNASNSTVVASTQKPKEDIVLPEWLVELPEDLEVYIAQREFVQAVDLVLKAQEFCQNHASESPNVREASVRLQEKIQHLINVLAGELSTEKSFQGGPRAARNAVQLLCRLGRSTQATDLFLHHRTAIILSALKSGKIESATVTYVQRQAVAFFAGVLETSLEFRKAFCKNQDKNNHETVISDGSDFFCQITTFITVCVPFVFWAQEPLINKFY